MRRSIAYSVVVVSMLLAAAATAAEPSDSTYDGQSSSGPVLLHQSHAPCVGGETVLVIQDTVEWFAPDDPRGNVVTELIAQGKSWCAIHSDELAGATLAPFGDIIIPSAQSQDFYDNLFPGGVIDKNLDAWVASGGVLSANLADKASGPGKGVWDGDVFVGGVQHEFASDDFVNIANGAHPIITGTAPCPSGNCGAITDTGQFTDLDGWSFSTHGYFTMLPGGTDVILVDAVNRPVMIEYPYGSGVVIATMTTSEWMYGGRLGQDPTGPFNKKLLANEIAYQESLVNQVITVGLDIKPHSFPNSISTKSRGRIPVAILSSPTFDAPAEVDKASLTFGRTGDEASLAFCTNGNEDVSDDGLVDVVCHFYNQATGFQIGDTEGVLKGVTQGVAPSRDWTQSGSSSSCTDAHIGPYAPAGPKADRSHCRAAELLTDTFQKRALSRGGDSNP